MNRIIPRTLSTIMCNYEIEKFIIFVKNKSYDVALVIMIWNIMVKVPSHYLLVFWVTLLESKVFLSLLL